MGITGTVMETLENACAFIKLCSHLFNEKFILISKIIQNDLLKLIIEISIIFKNYINSFPKCCRSHAAAPLFISCDRLYAGGAEMLKD